MSMPVAPLCRSTPLVSGVSSSAPSLMRRCRRARSLSGTAVEDSVPSRFFTFASGPPSPRISLAMWSPPASQDSKVRARRISADRETATRARCLSWQEVTMARDGLRGHLSGSLPISVAVHLVVLLMLFAVPLIGNLIVPTVMATAPGYMLAAPPPPPPAVLVRSAPRPPQNTATDTPTPIPTTAPTTILPERDLRRFDPGLAPPDSTAIGDTGGLPNGLVSPT